MKTVRNLNELKLVKQNLKFREMLYERDLAGATTAIVDNLTDKLRDLAFDFGMKIITHLIASFRKTEDRNQ